MMDGKELVTTIEHLLQEGKGILAADESNGTIGKRFASIGLENTENNRLRYRRLLANTSELENYVAGVILFEETFDQKNEEGIYLPEAFTQKGILPGIKVDKGLEALPYSEIEKITVGLDDLLKRLEIYKEKGAKFAKWRNVYSITEHTPSITAIKAGAEVLARYAAQCQRLGIVPIVEPELLMDGEHSIEDCAEAYALILHEVFSALFMHQVILEYIILKPSMVTSGISAKPFSSPDEVAFFTIELFRNHVPAAVPCIHFLSGGQSSTTATENLNAINGWGPQPWKLSFSFGRALQEDCLKTWAGKDAQVSAAQAVLLKRAYLNSQASLHAYGKEMEEQNAEAMA